MPNQVPHDVHAKCYESSELLHGHHGVRAPVHAILANLLFACSDPFQYSCLDNPMDRETWWVTVHRVRKSRA